MIANKKDYMCFLAADAKSMGVDLKTFKARINAHFTNPRWRFIKKLRKVELYATKKGLFNKIIYQYLWYKYKNFALKLGYSIPPRVIDMGLSLPHYGTIVISKNAKIGKNCRIHVCVNIGASGGNSKAPTIGDNVYIGPGAKLFGDIQIGNNNYIGSNAVVNKSFIEEGIIIGGVPARILKEDKMLWWEKNKLDLLK